MAQLRLPGGKLLELPTSGPTTIGHSDKATLRIENPDVAELHCVIRALKDGGFGLKDLGSRHGTRINGRPVHAVRLHHEDVIEVGDTTFVYDAPGDERRIEAHGTDGEHEGSTTRRDPAARTGHGTRHRTPIGTSRRGAHVAKDDPDLPIGKEIGGYRLEGILGHGGMGTVYRATQLSLHREVALKVLKSELCEDPDFVQRFTAEARAAGRFNHPNVVQVFDVGSADGRHFYSMELLEGGSLEERLRQQGKLDVSEALAATIDAARGLEYARELGLVHRDIKPDNLMITQQGTIKICDLGLAGDPSLLAEGKLLGTPHFLSPEQVRKEAADHRSDLYALGCTFYRLLTGKTPFHGKTVRDILRAHLETPPPLLRDVEPDAALFDPVIQRLLAKDPGERFETGAALAESLEAFYSAKKGPSRLLLAGLALLVIALGGGLAYVLTQNGGNTVIVQDDGRSEEMKRQVAALDAERAYLRISGELPPLERAKKLEEMAEAHPGTSYGKRALEEAATLREQETRRIAAEAERARLRQERYDALLEGASQALEAGRFAEAWRIVSELAGEEGARDEATRSAMAQLERELDQRIGARIAAALEALDRGIEAAEFAEAERTFTAALELGGDTLPAAVREKLANARTAADEKLAQARSAHARELEAERESWERKRIAILLGEDGVFARIAAGDFAAAAAQLRESRAPDTFADLWAPLGELANELEALAAGIDPLLRARSGVRIQKGDELWQLVDATWPELTLSRAGDDATTRRASLARDPDLVAGALATAKNDETREQRQLRLTALSLLALASDLPRVRAWAGEGEVPAPAPFGKALEDVAVTGLPDTLVAEIRAARSLAELLGSWRSERLARAAAAAAELEALRDARLARIVLGMDGGANGASPKER